MAEFFVHLLGGCLLDDLLLVLRLFSHVGLVCHSH